MKFIHLTDTHVVGGGQRLYGGDPASMLGRAVASINAEHGDAAFVAITGDLTHWGEAEAYAAFAAEIAKLTMPVHLLVGNHDVTEAFVQTFPDAPRDPNGFVQSTLDTEVGRCLFLDTHVPGTHEGAYCETRRNWLADELAKTSGPVFLFMHHPPFSVGLAGMDTIMLQEAETFYDVIAPHKDRIRHLFFGHLHRAVFGNWRGISFSCMRAVNHQVALTLDPSKTDVLGNRETPAYGVVLADADQVVVHMHDFTQVDTSYPLSAPKGEDKRAYALAFDPI
ncbi:phosphodiesterase [Epibacterium ulvae]|uniref:phosphodiesterase n=1 Tax=Epibacterium ulvae TaxID=1156985 RepID=UPI001BFC2453|nr:phosphodiesterase [Epibacterium ulvae]MBT8152642.1 phosphodiesterase [Epibacterium ulvae]